MGSWAKKLTVPFQQSDKLSEKRDLIRSAFRVSILVALIVGILSVYSLAVDVKTALRALREAPRDNVHWATLQIQSEFLRLQYQLDRVRTKDVATTDEFVQAFDIFYSRVQTVKTAPLLAPMRANEKFRRNLARLDAFTASLVSTVDAGPAHLSSSLSEIAVKLAAQESVVQELVVEAVTDFAAFRDRERLRLTHLVESLAVAGLAVFLLLIVAMVILGRHSRRLERRTRELADSEERLAATVSSALDAVIVAEPDGTIVDFNEQASVCFGYTRDEAIGAQLAELIVPEPMREAHCIGMARFHQTREAKIVGKRIEIDALHADGHEFPVELAIGVANRGASMLLVAYARDISQRKRDEQALREANDAANAASHAKSRFLAVMSHEMRTPLNGIIGVLQLLQETQLSKEQQSLVETANLSGELLLALVNDVLDLSKMQAGKLQLEPEEFDLRSIGNAVKDIVSSDATQRGNRIDLIYDDALSAWLIGDKKRIQQLLLNLVSNANKFTRNGHISLDVRADEQSDGRCHLRIAVEDTGIGIPADRLHQLFTEFTTLDNSYSRNQSGTGLGLAICKRIMDSFGGSIHVESTLGQGSRFWVEFDLEISERCAACAPAEASDECDVPTARRSLSVLIAEDNPTNAMVVKGMVASAGHDVEIVSDGQDAIAHVSKGNYDIVLMDISMPFMDGLEATQHIRALPGPVRHIPIVALTAHAQPEHQKEFLEAGMNGILTKPVRKHELLNVLLMHTRVHKPHDMSAGHDSPTLDESELLDTEQLDQMRRDVGSELLSDIIDQFVCDARAYTRRIRTAQTQEDPAQLQKAAHALAGCARTMGAETLGRYAERLERACEQMNVDEMRALPSQIESIHQRTAHLLGDVGTSRQDHL